MRPPSLFVKLCLGALLATGAFAQDNAQMRFEVYPLGSADMESTLDAVRGFVGEQGQVTADPVHQRLLVATTAERHAQIAALMNQLVVPERNVLIEVSFTSAGTQDSFDASVSGSGSVEWNKGIDGRITLKPRLESQSSSTSGRTIQTLLVSSGREATLRVGESVPYLQWMMENTAYYGWNIPQLAWQQVGSFLIVQPTVLGDGPLLRIRLTPELRGLVDGRAEHARFTALSTEVTARDGETISLGGLGENRSFYDRFLVGLSRNGGAQSVHIQLTPRIQAPNPSPPR